MLQSLTSWGLHSSGGDIWYTNKIRGNSKSAGGKIKSQHQLNYCWLTRNWCCPFINVQYANKNLRRFQLLLVINNYYQSITPKCNQNLSLWWCWRDSNRSLYFSYFWIRSILFYIFVCHLHVPKSRFNNIG